MISYIAKFFFIILDIVHLLNELCATHLVSVGEVKHNMRIDFHKMASVCAASCAMEWWCWICLQRNDGG
jgi:hypothetical protein